MAALYDLKDEYLIALRDMEAAGFDAETIADTLDGMDGDLKSKIRNVAYAIKNREADVFAIKGEMERLSKRAKQAANGADSLRRYLFEVMKATGVTVDDAAMPVKLNKAADKLGEIDITLVPKKFFTQPPTPPKQLDRRELLKAAKLAPVKGVQVITDGLNLKIG